MARDRATRRAPEPPPPSDAPTQADDSVTNRALTLRGRRTRAKLVEAARDVFNRVGFFEVRIADITDHAGVASGTFYTYFDSKEEIFREVAAQVLAEMQMDRRGAPDNPLRDPVRDLEFGTRRYFEVIRGSARVARSMEELHMRDPGLGKIRRKTLVRGVKQLERWIRKLQERGICDRDLDAWSTAMALHAMTVSIAYDHLVHRDAPEETERLVQATTRIWRATVGL